MVTPERPGSSVRIAVAGAKEQSCRALKAFLSTFRGLEVVAEARTRSEAVSIARLYRPDVLLVGDLHPTPDIFQAVREIKRLCPGTAVVVMTSGDELIPDTMAAGADAFLIGGSCSHELVSMIRNIALKSSQRLERQLKE